MPQTSFMVRNQNISTLKTNQDFGFSASCLHPIIYYDILEYTRIYYNIPYYTRIYYYREYNGIQYTIIEYTVIYVAAEPASKVLPRDPENPKPASLNSQKPSHQRAQKKKTKCGHIGVIQGLDRGDIGH